MRAVSTSTLRIRRSDGAAGQGSVGWVARSSSLAGSLGNDRVGVAEHVLNAYVATSGHEGACAGLATALPEA